MFIAEKRGRDMEGRLVYIGKPTRDWISREDKSSLTALTESILLAAGIDALQGRDVMCIDIPNAFIQTNIPIEPHGERTRSNCGC